MLPANSVLILQPLPGRYDWLPLTFLEQELVYIPASLIGVKLPGPLPGWIHDLVRSRPSPTPAFWHLQPAICSLPMGYTFSPLMGLGMCTMTLARRDRVLGNKIYSERTELEHWVQI